MSLENVIPRETDNSKTTIIGLSGTCQDCGQIAKTDNCGLMFCMGEMMFQIKSLTCRGIAAGFIVFLPTAASAEDRDRGGPLDSAKTAASTATDALGPLISQAKEFLPKLGAALAILVVGWIFACVIAWIVARVIRKTPLNGMLANYFPGDSPDAAKPLSKIVYYIVMLFVLIGFFQALQLDMITKPLNSFLDQVFLYAPRFLAAGILGAVAWVVARVVRTVSLKALTTANIDGKLAALTAPDDTDWDQAYEALLQKKPQVQEAVAEGRLSKEKVVAELKERRRAAKEAMWLAGPSSSYQERWL